MARENFDYPGAANAMIEKLESVERGADRVGPRSMGHFYYMRSRMTDFDDKEKAAQWLGYLNAAYVFLAPYPDIALEEVKEISRRFDPAKNR